MANTARKTFKLTDRTKKVCPVDSEDEPLPFYCPRYKNRASLAEFLGDSQASWLECVAVRLVQWINGCGSLDWTHENWIITCIRETGPGMRIGYFLSAFSIVVLSTIYLDVPLIAQYSLYSDLSSMRFGNATMTLAFALWSIDYGALCWAYFLIRYEGATSRPFQDGECTPFYRLPVRKLREFRVGQPVTSYTWSVRIVMGIFYFVYFILGIISTHTVLSHMFVARNPWFASILVLQAIVLLVASIDDLSQIGSPWGASMIPSFLF